MASHPRLFLRGSKGSSPLVPRRGVPVSKSTRGEGATGRASAASARLESARLSGAPDDRSFGDALREVLESAVATRSRSVAQQLRPDGADGCRSAAREPTVVSVGASRPCHLRGDAPRYRDLTSRAVARGASLQASHLCGVKAWRAAHRVRGSVGSRPQSLTTIGPTVDRIARDCGRAPLGRDRRWRVSALNMTNPPGLTFAINLDRIYIRR
jgi:hypothetical protein